MSRIPVAKDRGTTIQRWMIKEPTSERFFEREHLVCGGKGCTARVSPVVGHKKAGAWVEAHFRLRPGQEHSPGCKYDVEGRVQVLAADYPESGTVLAGVYRLELREPGVVPTPLVAVSRESVRTSRTGVEYRPSGVTVPRTLQAAKQIRRIIHEFVEAPSVAARFRATYRGVTYSWPQFFFEAEHDAQKLGAAISRSTDYPRVVRGKVKFRDPFKNGEGVALVLASDQQASWPGSDQGVKIVLRTTAPNYLPYEPGDTVIAYGKWSRFTPRNGTNDEAQLWINEPRNVTPD